MANHNQKHFVDPKHLLTETEYNVKSTRTCNICLLELAGLAGYCCDDCDIHIHKACADHFEQSIDFFVDRHRLNLVRTPGGDRASHMCDLCREKLPPASFVYRCTECDFDLHPLCSLLPETVDSPLHPGHVLHMITSPSVSCSVCHGPLPLWHYMCSCSVNFKVHIACVMDIDNGGGGGGPGIQGSYGAADQRGFGPAAGQQAGSHGAVDQRGFSPAAGLGNNFVDPAVMIQGHGPFFQGFIPNINIPGYGLGIPGIYGHAIPGYGPGIPGIHGHAIPGYVPGIPGIHGHAIPGYVPGIPGIHGHAIPVYGPSPGFGSPIMGSYSPSIPGYVPTASQNIAARPSRCSAIAKFLLQQSFGAALTVATGGLLGSSPLVDLLSSALNN